MENYNDKLKRALRNFLAGSTSITKNREVSLRHPDMETLQYTISFGVMTSGEYDMDKFIDGIIDDVRNIYNDDGE